MNQMEESVFQMVAQNVFHRAFADRYSIPWNLPMIFHPGAFLYSAHCSFGYTISLRSVWCRRAMIPGEIFTSFSEFQWIVNVNDFQFLLGFQELLQASQGLLRSFGFARIRLDPLSG